MSSTETIALPALNTLKVDARCLSHISTLDSLRAIAVLLVFWEHIPKQFLGPTEAAIRTALFPGALGVDLFFILSGFLITRILLAEKQAGPSLKSFYLRRVFRILPAYFCTLLICLLITREIVPVLLAGAFVLNIPLTWISQYLSPPFVHLWSLCVEEHFYLLWPLVIFFLPFRVVVGITILAAFASFVLMNYFATLNDEMGARNAFWAAYGFTGSRVYSIFAGGLIAFIEPVTRPKTVKMLVPLLILISFYYWQENYPFPTWGGFRASDHLNMLFPLSLAIFLLFLMADQSAKLRKAIANPVLVFLGRISYGLYLYHYPVFYLFGAINVPANFNVFPQVLNALIVTFGVACLSYYYVERPCLRWAAKLRS